MISYRLAVTSKPLMPFIGINVKRIFVDNVNNGFSSTKQSGR